MGLRDRVAALLPLARYRVEGESMLPDVTPGERVLVNRRAYRSRAPRAGDLVALRDPRDGRLLLKRIAGAVDGDRWNVTGANGAASTDSRTFGPVDRDLIVGKVWLRY